MKATTICPACYTPIDPVNYLVNNNGVALRFLHWSFCPKCGEQLPESD